MSGSGKYEIAEDPDSQTETDSGLLKALDSYRSLFVEDEMTEAQKEDLEENLREIRRREVIESNSEHEPVEIPSENGRVLIGPNVMTRFEKARIMGARALQLSLGAPPFINIPETASTSLDIAMEELEKRLIPIILKRALPNGDHQNIPIGYFK